MLEWISFISSWPSALDIHLSNNEQTHSLNNSASMILYVLILVSILPIQTSSSVGYFPYRIISNNQSSLWIREMVNITIASSLIQGAFRNLNNTLSGKGSPWATNLTSIYACSFSPVGIYFLLRIFQSMLPSFGLWWDTSPGLNFLPNYFLSTWHVITYESNLRKVLFTPMALNFQRPNSMALYSSMLLMH